MEFTIDQWVSIYSITPIITGCSTKTVMGGISTLKQEVIMTMLQEIREAPVLLLVSSLYFAVAVALLGSSSVEAKRKMRFILRRKSLRK